MNYRHAFHAGNFADLVKHAALLQLLARLTTGAPLSVIDTHAGRGLYDLQGAEARKSGEAAAGIVRLMAALDAPQAFGPLKAAVSGLNAGPNLRRYPGSPWLTAQALRPSDALLACELRPDEHGALREALKEQANVRTLCADGFAIASAEAPPRGRVLVLIDPPFERADDYARIVETAVAVRERNKLAVLMIWTPIKDLTTWDGFLGDFEDAVGASVLVGETRIQPLADPMKMNGCGLTFVGAPEDLAGPLEAICQWTAQTLGQGGQGSVYRA